MKYCCGLVRAEPGLPLLLLLSLPLPLQHILDLAVKVILYISNVFAGLVVVMLQLWWRDNIWKRGHDELGRYVCSPSSPKATT